MGLRVVHEVVCTYYGLEKLEIFQRTRKKEIIAARQMFHYQAKENTKLSQEKIGNYYSENSGNSWDHASVGHSFKVVENLKEVYKSVGKDAETMGLIIKGIDDRGESNLPIIKERLLKMVIHTDNLEDLLSKVRIYTDNILDKNNSLDE